MDQRKIEMEKNKIVDVMNCPIFSKSIFIFFFFSFSFNYVI